MAAAVEIADLELTPGPDEVRELAREHTLVPLRHRFIADCETPVSACLKLRGEGPSILLESAEQGRRFGRWSFLGFRPRSVMRLARGELSVEPAVGSSGPDAVEVPDMALMISDVLVAFDHLRHEVTVLANVLTGRDLERAYLEAASAIADVRERLAAPVPRVRAGPREPPDLESNVGAAGYAEWVERAKEYIRAGDVYQVVPSQRWSGEVPVEAFSIYRGLRTVNPSPYMYFLDFGDFQIAGASPEPLVKVSGRRVEQRPIAGTRPRAATAEADLERGRELLADEKERAEHVMLVDLGRNDLGRVCEYGSVSVDELMVVETYSHVMHIVSSVSGRLREGVGAMDVLRAVLPAGTLSGAPKGGAMQIIDELEPHKSCS